MTLISLLSARPAPAAALLAALCVLAAPSVSLSSSNTRQSEANFEIRFLEEMIDRLALRADVMRSGEDKGLRDELRDFSERVSEREGQEIRMMQSWLRDWYGIEYEPQVKAAEKRRVERLTALEGAAFETAFLDFMLHHNRDVYENATACVQGGFGHHDELRTASEQMIKAAGAEIGTMQDWACWWYQRCGPVVAGGAALPKEKG